MMVGGLLDATLTVPVSLWLTLAVVALDNRPSASDAGRLRRRAGGVRPRRRRYAAANATPNNPASSARQHRGSTGGVPLSGLLIATGALFAAWHGASTQTLTADHLVHRATFDPTPICCDVIVERGDRPRQPQPRPFAIHYGDGPLTTLRVRAVSVRVGATWRPAIGTGRMVVVGDWAGANAGDRLRVLATISQPRPPANPGTFDFAQWSHRRGLWYSLSVDLPECVTVLERGSPWNLTRGLDALRNHFEDNLRRHLPREQADLAVALMLGDRTGIAPEKTELYLVTGAVHLLSISGLHVAILAGGVAGLMRLLTRRRRVMLVVVLVVLAIYVPLTGAQTPVLRAATLIAAWCVGRWSGRPTHLMQSLSVALIVVLIFRPADLFDAGAQLSFLAVMALALAARLVRRSEAVRNEALHHDILASEPPTDDAPVAETVSPSETKLAAESRSAIPTPLPWWRQYLSGLLTKLSIVFQAGLMVWLLCLPMVCLRFHVMPLGIVAINPILGLLITFALWACLITMLLGTVIPPLASLAGFIATLALVILEQILYSLRAVPLSYLWLPAPAEWWVMMTYVLLGRLGGHRRTHSALSPFPQANGGRKPPGTIITDERHPPVKIA